MFLKIAQNELSSNFDIIDQFKRGDKIKTLIIGICVSKTIDYAHSRAECYFYCKPVDRIHYSLSVQLNCIIEQKS